MDYEVYLLVYETFITHNSPATTGIADFFTRKYGLWE